MHELGSLDQLLGFALDALDVPKALQDEAKTVYDDLGAWAIRHDAVAGRREPSFFPQGSAALGTTTLGNGDWDIDAVYERPISRTSTTQSLLKTEAMELLQGFRSDQRRLGKTVPKIEERPRCLRLTYSGFHIDALPAIPEDLNDNTSTRLLIADRDLREWIGTDPKGYIAWFIERMGVGFEQERAAIAKASERSVEEVPAWETKTVLQRAVQYVRMHRDHFFAEEPDGLSPASILVTTLAARSYEGELSLAEALVNVGHRLPSHLEKRNDELWVSNPTDDHLPENTRENLARAIAGDPIRTAKFEQWVTALCADLLGLGNATGQGLRQLISKAVGGQPTIAADKRVAELRTRQRDANQLRMSAGTGMLGATGSVPVKGHTFHGDPED
jgi:cyclic GMP-AMP synthase DncV-like protein